MLDKIKNDAENRMSKRIDAIKKDLIRLRTGRASTALVEGIRVPCHGTWMPLNQVASVALSDPRCLVITPFEKTMIGPVEKALITSDIGITPTTTGTIIRLNMPPLNEQRRRELARHVTHEGENAKITIRNIRRDALQQIKNLLKDKHINKDEGHRGNDDVQKLTDRFIKEVDVVVKTKEDELMTL